MLDLGLISPLRHLDLVRGYSTIDIPIDNRRDGIENFSSCILPLIVL